MKKCLLFVLITVLLFTACSSKEEGSSEDIIGNSGLPEYIDLEVIECYDNNTLKARTLYDIYGLEGEIISKGEQLLVDYSKYGVIVDLRETEDNIVPADEEEYKKVSISKADKGSYITLHEFYNQVLSKNENGEYVFKAKDYVCIYNNTYYKNIGSKGV